MEVIKSKFFGHKDDNLSVNTSEDSQLYPGGGHTYELRECVGWDNENQCTKFVDSAQTIHFVRKNLEGELSPGITSEQVIQMLIHRHEELDKAFPSQEGKRCIEHLKQALHQLEERAKVRVQRGVMGELKA